MANTKLEVTLVGNEKDAKRAIESTERSLAGLGETANRSGGHFAGLGDKLATVGKVGAAAFAGAVVAGGALTGVGIKIAGNMEQAQIGFTTLLGSAEKADAFIKDMKAFAARTPFEFAGLQESASKLIAVGVEANRVIPLMTVLGDATSAVGTGAEGIDRAVTALSQMQQKGKVTGEEMLQLVEAGIPAWDALAAKLGVDVPRAQDMVSKGQVKVNDLFVALESKAGPALQRVTGMMDKQADSLQGLWSTIKDNFSIGLADAFASQIPELKRVMMTVSGALQEGMGVLGPALADNLGGVLAAFSEVMPEISSIVSTGIGTVGTAFSAILSAATPLLPVLEEVASILGGALQSAFSELGPMVRDMVEALRPLLPALASLAGVALKGLLAILGPIVQAMTPFLSQLADSLGPVLAELAPVLADFGRELGVTLAQNIKEMAPLIVELLKALIPLIPPLTKLITLALLLDVKLQSLILRSIVWLIAKLGALQAVIDPVIGTMQAWGAAIADWGRTAGQWLTGVPEMLGRIVEWFEALPGQIAGWLAGTASAMWAWISDTAAAIPGQIAGWATAFGTWALQVAAELPGKLAYITGFVIGWLVGTAAAVVVGAVALAVGFFTWTTEVVTSLPGRLAEIAGQVWGWIAATAAALPGQLASWAATFFGWAANLAGSIAGWLGATAASLAGWLASMPGMIAGFLQGWAAMFANWAFGVASNIPGWLGGVTSAIRGFISSVPGQVAGAVGELAEVGRNMAEAIWRGLQGMAGWLADRVRNFASGIVDGIKSALKISSPSKEMIWVGEMLGAGLGIGLERSSATLEATVSGVSGGVVTSAAAHVPSGAADVAIGGQRGDTNLYVTVQVEGAVVHTERDLGRYLAGALQAHLDSGGRVPALPQSR